MKWSVKKIYKCKEEPISFVKNSQFIDDIYRWETELDHQETEDL